MAGMVDETELSVISGTLSPIAFSYADLSHALMEVGRDTELGLNDDFAVEV